jgi:uncharacterized protein YndB with AHSA1/START domain
VAQTETPALIVETIEIEAPMATVFAALTEPEQLTAWWGSDDSYHCTAMECDLHVGGAWKTSGRGRDGKPFTVGGVYRIVEPPRILEFSWRHDWHDGDDPAADTIVRYELEERDGVTTQLTMTHWGFASMTDRNNHAAGWKTVLGWLRAFVSR